MKPPHITFLLPAICLAIAVGASASDAEPSTHCGKSGAESWTEMGEALVGYWKIQHHSGFALAGGMVIPFPSSPETEVVTISLIGDALEASHPEMQSPMVLRLADEPRWTMDGDNPAIPLPSLSLSDVELAVGCDQMQLPRIIGTASAMVEGTKMDFVNRLIFVDDSTLYGVMEINTVAHGIPVQAMRTVSLLRDGAQ